MDRYVLHPQARDAVLDWWPHLSSEQKVFLRRLLEQLQQGGLSACTFYRQPALENEHAEDVPDGSGG